MSFLPRTFASGLSRREIDRYVLQEEAKRGWQWYADVDLRPWHSLVGTWRSNAPYRSESGCDLFVRIVKASMFYPTAALVVFLVGFSALLVFASYLILENCRRFLKGNVRLFTERKGRQRN